VISTPSSPELLEKPTEATPPVSEEEQEKIALREALEAREGVTRLHHMGAVRSIIRNMDHEDDLVRRNLEAHEKEMLDEYIDPEESGEDEMGRTDTMAARDVITNNYYGQVPGTEEPKTDPNGGPVPKPAPAPPGDAADSHQPATQPKPAPVPKPAEPERPRFELPDLPPLPGAALLKPALAGLSLLAAMAGTSGLTAWLVAGSGPTVDLTEIHNKIDALTNRPAPVLEFEIEATEATESIDAPE